MNRPNEGTKTIRRIGPVILAAALLGAGCHDAAPLAPADHLTRERGTSPEAPALELVLAEYSAAFAAGDLESIRTLLSPAFEYAVDPGCVHAAICGASFPWDCETELAWLEHLPAGSTERHCDFYPAAATELPRHRWRMMVGLDLGVRRGTGGGSSCNGTIQVEFAPGPHGGMLIERMTPRRWFRDDDGCSLVHFRCLH